MIHTKNILITGRPGIGKTTLIQKLAGRLRDRRPRGFYTEEIRQAGVRKGFRLVDLEDGRLILAHVDFASRQRVGKYGVDVQSFDDYLRIRDFAGSAGRLVIIDEIGKMECFSELFVRMIVDILDSDKTIIATIAEKGGGVIQQVRNRDDVHLIKIDTGNRDSMVDLIVHMLPWDRTR
jgi:nucleoside-triphosphatase